ncbi:MAG: tryptophan 2,3-dioxygenase [Deltaproteobacteria bacterium]|nr:tryptophan 2,3-dioxygenase [Deltaproteobacteria bacterium]MBK9372063.1 tryptophan 2,3-dioxygenase [Deltaproteobacteria bacterium]
MARGGLYYGDYLQLERLLSAQTAESGKLGQAAHDELLFIIVHQAYELWFKQILFEMDAVQGIFSADQVDDRDVGTAARLLGRIWEILKLGVHQLDVLETMTPLDFLDFRDHLVPASGFQSAQFRQIEVRLGLRRQDRINFEDKPFDARLQGADRDRVNHTEQVKSLHDQVEAWLERTPFIEMGGFTFRESYRKVVTDMLSRDEETIRTNPLLQDAEREVELAGLKRAQVKFDALFDESIHAAQREEGGWRLSWRALQAALFITLYRDEPALQVPFTLLSRMMDIDETLTIWRYRHSLMVQRMIGLKIGTGGSSGHQYLRRTAEQHRVFGDLFALSTFLIPRSALPALPDAVRAEMGLTYSRKG